MLRVLKERSGQCKKRIRTGSQIKLLLAKDFLACFLILSLDVSSCLFFFFSSLIELFFIASREANLLQAQTSLTIWSSHSVPNSCHFLCSLTRNSLASSSLAYCCAPQAVCWGCPWSKRAACWRGAQETSDLPPLHCHSIFHFLEVEKLFWIPLTSISSRKSKFSPGLQEPFA